ncbi:MAG: ABC transporter ATP-binding protein [Clostridiaceae bacterium]|nr:ABC transporter ATP-binding protein [Clostridiaceae bacterium]MDY5888668.1 ABC transporter ATP-binding protein [Oscillospiraceae bacterium]
MKDLLKYLRHYVKESILAPLFKMLEASFELFVPLVIAAIIDTGIKNSDKPYIFKMVMVLVALAVVGFISALTAQYFAAKAAVGFGKELRSDLYRHINTLSYSEIDKIGTSTLITRLTADVNQMQTAVNLFLRLFLRSPFIVIGAVVMAFTVDPKTAVIFAVSIPLLAVVVFGIMFCSVPIYKKVQTRLDSVMRITRENLSGVRVIRAFNHEQREIEDFDKCSGELKDMQLYGGRISAYLNPITYVIVNLSIVLIIYVGGLRVDTGRLTQGEVISLINYMSQVLVELIKLSNLIINLTKSVACGNRINDVFKLSPSVNDGNGEKTEGKFAVEFDNVSAVYSGSKEKSLDSLTLRVPRGATVGVIGATGSGKTTLVNLIPRFYDVSEGTVKVNGTDVRNYGTEELREKVGVVPQKAALVSGTVRDNMKWGKPNATDDEINAALKTAQALGFVNEKEGLDTKILQGGKNLSGGQIQRLTIARALVRKPDILILDDSSSALDFATDAALRKAIKSDTENMTVFIVSQRFSTIKNADMIVVLDDGKVCGIGKHEELFENCEEYRDICKSQLSSKEAV